MAVIYIVRSACVWRSSQFRIGGMSGSSFKLSQMSVKILFSTGEPINRSN